MRRMVPSLIVVCLIAGVASAQMQKFDFGTPESPLAEGFTRVTPESVYTDAAGFGWKSALRVVPKVGNWWNADQKGGILTAIDTAKGTAAGSDYVFGYHYFGWKHDGDLDKQGVNRLNITMDDDLGTDFIVKVKPGKVSLLIAMGDLDVDHRFRPWRVDVNGQRWIGPKGYATMTLERKSAIDCSDGKLTLTFRGDPGYKHPYPWNQCTWWMVNFLMVAPTEQEKEIDAALAGLETSQFDALKRQYIPPDESQKFAVTGGYLVKDGKPFLRLLYHGWGWSDVLKHYRLYAWTNTINLGKSTKFFYYDDWSLDDPKDTAWRKRALSGAFPSDWFDDARQAYNNGYLVNYYYSREAMWYLPSSYRKQHPDAVGVQPSGKRETYNRRFGDPGGDLFTRRSATTLADFAKLHPASGTVEIFEEYWLPNDGFHPEAIRLYQEWLKDKYGTLDALNAEWGSTYRNFGEIVPPKAWEASGNYVNHMLWKGHMNVRIAKIAYDAIKAADPARPVAGAKGQFGIASWDYAPATDVFGWYGHANMDLARAAAEHFGKVLCPVHVNVCQHQTMRGGTPVDTYPFMNYREAAYSLMLTRVIDGAKSIFNEDYGMGHDFHYFHRTKALRGQKLEGTLGGEVKLDRDDYPDVYLESKSLQLARVNQLLLRLAPVFLPARVPKSKVAMLATTETSFLSGPNAFYSNQTRLGDELFKRLHIPYDVLRRPIFDKMKDYDVVVLGPLAQAITPDDAEKIKAFVAGGGKLIVVPPAAWADARTLKGRNFGLAGLAGCTGAGDIDSGGDLKITVTANDLIRSLKEGDALPGYTKRESKKLASLELTDGVALAEVDGKPVAAASKDRRVVTVILPQVRPTYGGLPVAHFDANTVKFFGDIFDAWKVTRPVKITGGTEPHMIDAGVLEGRDSNSNRYWLVFLASYSRDAQAVNAKLAFLPDGNYDVVDVTGERPLIAPDATGQNVFTPDPVYRRSFYVAKGASKETLADTAGVPLEVGALMGRVLLVRQVIPQGSRVWVNCPADEINALLLKPLIIVPGTSEGDRKAAERVAGWFPRMGVKATIVPAAEIKTRTVTNEIVIDDFKVADFTSTPLDVDTNLILIGNETTNPVIRHLGAAGTFCFDKVLMKVDGAFPGPGRGVIQVVESVNNEAYDWTPKGRDAIVISGSDDAGLGAALNAFYGIGWPRR